MLRTLGVALLLTVIPALNAAAATIQLDFSLPGFYESPGFNYPSAPTDPVSGSVVFTVDDNTWEMTSLDLLDLTIDGHTYSLSEVGFVTDGGAFNIGATTAPEPDINSIGTLADDFVFRIGQGAIDPFDFIYASSSTEGVWLWPATPGTGTWEVTYLEDPPPSAPEPTATILLGAGLAAALARSRRRARTAATPRN